MAKFLSKFSDADVYIFGGSGNIFNMFSLFDKVYFLKLRLSFRRSDCAALPGKTLWVDMNESGIIVWGDWFEEQAQKFRIPFIDASLTPKEIFAIISKK